MRWLMAPHTSPRDKSRCYAFLVLRSLDAYACLLIPVRSNTHQPRVLFLASSGDSQQRLDRLRRGDDDPVRLDDPRLLRGDFRQRIAQYLHVIVADRRNHGDERLRNIVASSLPPSPTSSTACCTCWRRK